MDSLETKPTEEWPRVHTVFAFYVVCLSVECLLNTKVFLHLKPEKWGKAIYILFSFISLKGKEKINFPLLQNSIFYYRRKNKKIKHNKSKSLPSFLETTVISDLVCTLFNPLSCVYFAFLTKLYTQKHAVFC